MRVWCSFVFLSVPKLECIMPKVPNLTNSMQWAHPQAINPALQFNCGYCGRSVASDKGYIVQCNPHGMAGAIAICPNCKSPTFKYPGEDFFVPDSPMGDPVMHAPRDLEQLYEESRSCTSYGCYTGAVLLLRKMLMNIAVTKGATEGQSFQKYVEFLRDQHIIPKDGEPWVDHIRKKGNEATHEITAMTREDAEDLLLFVEMLLKTIYEFPHRIKARPPK